jgi:hypothetical protein
VATVPPAPWRLRLDGLVWQHRAVPDAERFHQPGLPVERVLPRTVAGLARYRESPVGPYAEVWGSPTLVVHRGRAALGVPFMAVDSPASLRGGRQNWGLPKELATFTEECEAVAEDGSWSVRARPVSTGPRLPLLVGGHLLQVGEDGRLLRTLASARGFARPARIRVDGELPAWMAPGTHHGFAIERAVLVVAAPGVASMT